MALAVGIGANTAVFSVVNGVIFRPLPYEEPEELLRLWARFLPESGYEGEAFPISPREVVEYRDATSALGEIAYYSFGSFTLTAAGARPQELPVIQASAGLFPVLGVPPELGRWFSKDEDVPDGPAVAVLSHALWRSRFAAAPDIIGRSMTLSGVTFEIVGVMPKGFGFPNPQTRVYLPFQLNEPDPGGWGWHGIHAISRLADGRSLEQADAGLASLILAWREEFGHPQLGHSVYLTPLREDAVRGVSRMLWLLMGAVVLVLLIASANVANLLLARGESRSREVSLRVALGAGNFRILRQFLTESVVLAGAVALLGVGLAQALVRAALLINPDVLPRSETIAMGLPVLAFTVAVALGSAILFGLVAGRRLDARDRNGTDLVALINQETQRLFWPGEDPLGQRIGFRIGSDTIPWATVVGIVENTRTDGLQGEIRPQIYLPHGQEQGFWGANERSGAIVLEAAVDPVSLVPVVRRELAQADGELPLTNVRTMQDIVDDSVAQPRLTSGLLGSFGLIALLLAMVGVYGVVSYSVARRIKEIGVRIALGAETHRVVALMVWEGARPALWGIVLGLIGAWGQRSLLEGFLFGVSPTDPVTFASLSVTLAAVALLASWIPSRRAAGVAPTEALRED